MRHRVQLHAMRAFEAVSRHEDFARAADELKLSKTELCNYLVMLEQQLGVRLFASAVSDVTLTRAGRLFLPIASGAVDLPPANASGKTRMKLSDMLLAISVVLLWSTGFVFAKGAIEFFPPILLMCLRFTVTALVLIWFVKPPPRVLMPLIFATAFVSAAIQYSLTFTGLKGLDASLAIFVVQLEVPLASLLAAIVFKDVLGWRRSLGMVLGFTGIAFIALFERSVQVDYVPLLLVIGGSFTWAIGQIMVKKIGPIGGFSLIAWIALFTAPQLLVLSLIFETNHLDAFRSANWVVWGAVAYMGVIMTAVGYAMWYRLLGLYDINQVMPYLLLLPVFGVTGGVVLLGESVSLIVIVGGMIAVTGVGIIITARTPR
jgi:O-acetylserine/cysteine efflux transporter